MPIYEFQCEECGSVTEVIYKMADAPQDILVICPTEMRSSFHRRIISLSSHHLKGKGWSKDGYENPAKHLPGGQHSGDKFLREYRKAVSDPEHPYKPGMGLKAMGRKDDYSDLGQDGQNTTQED